MPELRVCELEERTWDEEPVERVCDDEDLVCDDEDLVWEPVERDCEPVERVCDEELPEVLRC